MLHLLLLSTFCTDLIGAVESTVWSQWPEQKVRLSPEGSLRELFAAGLRPYRFPRMENSQLEFKHSRVTFIQSDGIELPTFDTEWADVSVLDGGFISSIVLKQRPETLPTCRAEMLKWLPFGSNPKRTITELDEFLKAVAKDYRGYNYGPNAVDHDFRLIWMDSNGLRFTVWLQQARLPKTPLLVQMQVGWKRPEIQERHLYTVPIPPPAGYDDVDMTAPKDFGPDNPPPDPEVERVMKAGVMPDYSTLPKDRIRSSEAPSGRATMPLLPSEGKIPNEAPGAGPLLESSKATSITWLWWMGGIALVISIWVVVSRRNSRYRKCGMSGSEADCRQPR